MEKFSEDLMKVANECVTEIYKYLGTSPWYIPNIIARTIDTDRKRRVKELVWHECLAYGNNRTLIARDCFGNEFARIDLPLPESEIQVTKAAIQIQYEQALMTAFE